MDNPTNKIRVMKEQVRQLSYHLGQLTKLIEEHGKIDKITYELMLKTLDYIEIGTDDIAIANFLAGVKLKINDLYKI